MPQLITTIVARSSDVLTRGVAHRALQRRPKRGRYRAVPSSTG